MRLTEIRERIAKVSQQARDAVAYDVRAREALQHSAGVMHDRYELVSALGAVITTETARGVVLPPSDMEEVQVELDALNARAAALIETRDEWAMQFARTLATLARYHDDLLTAEAAAVFAATLNQLKAPDGNQQQP